MNCPGSLKEEVSAEGQVRDKQRDRHDGKLAVGDNPEWEAEGQGEMTERQTATE